MNDDNNDDELKHLWKEQPVSTTTFSLDALKADAKRMHRRIAVRNAMEYAACVVVLVVFGFYVYAFPYPAMRVGSVLTMLATCFVAWQMRRRASSHALPSDPGGQPWLQFQRAQLVRQRDALRSVWLWYVAPFIPGVVVFRWGVETAMPLDGPFARGWVANLIIALVLVGVAAWNRFAARKLQQRIDKLDEQAG